LFGASGRMEGWLFVQVDQERFRALRVAVVDSVIRGWKLRIYEGLHTKNGPLHVQACDCGTNPVRNVCLSPFSLISRG